MLSMERKMRKRGFGGAVATAVATLVLLAFALLAGGCGEERSRVPDDGTAGRPERVTAYEAVQFTKPAADKWQAENWAIHVKDGDPDGVGADGKARIWEVFYFSPTPEETCQLLVLYNRGHVWPSAPTRNKGGEEGRETYIRNRPQDFRVDSGEARTVANRNGGAEFLDSHEDAVAHCALRSRGDYDAIGEKMPAPKYKWIWNVSYREPNPGAERFTVLVDGMNGDFITTESGRP